MSQDELREALEWAESRGWTAEPTNGGHIKLTHPEGGLVFAPATPSDWRAVKNLRSQVKRQERQAQQDSRNRKTPEPSAEALAILNKNVER